MTIFESVRQLIRESDTAQALRLLITHLEQEKNDPDTLQTLRVMEANLSATKQKEIKGILSFSEARQLYSKITDDLLSIAGALEAGIRPGIPKDGSVQGNSRIYWLIGGGILLLLGLIAGILLRNNPEVPAGDTAKPSAECPVFDKKGISIMLIPFQNLGDGSASPELAIQARIRNLTQNNNLMSDVQIFPGDRFEKNTPDIDDAAEVGRHCDAKMVIWGQFEKVSEGISLDVHYVFTEKPNLPGGAIAETFRNLSELRADGKSFDTIEDAIFSLCTALALHEGRMELAEKWLDKVVKPDPQQQKIKEMLKSQ